MNIDIIQEIPFAQLEQKVRRVPLKKVKDDGSKIFVYEHARISLRTVYPEELNPTTFYLLEQNLEFQRELRQHLMSNHSIDSLALNGGLEIENKENGQLWTLMPPVVEVSEEDVIFMATRGDLQYKEQQRIKVPIINDGAHRVYTAMQEKLPINIIFIKGISSEHPFYAYPNNWSDVKVVNQVPAEMKNKKLYRRSDSYTLYRDFNVLGCGTPRYTGKKE